MNALNRFLRSAEARALVDHEKRLARVRLADLPDDPRERAVPAEPEPFHQGRCASPEMQQAIRNARRGGLTNREIAERYGCSERTVLRWLARSRS